MEHLFEPLALVTRYLDFPYFTFEDERVLHGTEFWSNVAVWSEVYPSGWQNGHAQ